MLFRSLQERLDDAPSEMAWCTYDLNVVEYWDHPWEIDAAGRELGLYIRFINHMVERGKL